MFRVIFAFAASLLMFVSAHAAPRDVIVALGDRQAYEWRRVVIDLNQLRPYYRSENPTLLWVQGGKPSQRVTALFEALERASEDGLEAADYLPPSLTDFADLAGDEDVAGFELAISQIFLQFARDLHAGRTSPSVSDPTIVIARKTIDAKRWLAAVRDGDIATTVEALRPKHPQYGNLRRLLAGYQALADRGGWPEIAAGPSLKPGMTDPRVASLRANLQARGYGGLDDEEASFYSDYLAEIIKHFQRRYGLQVDGVAGPATIGALNVPAKERARQIIVNLERWRWLPSDLGARHVLVNQAGFEMHMIAGGKTVDSRRVIVGKPYHKSPMFSDAIAYAEFNPTWNVPASIAVAEFLPKLRKDPGYLQRNDYVLYKNGTNQQVNPYAVNWSRVSKRRFPYRIVQRAGRRNALGTVKFIFPNKFNVYLHDTPTRQLFAKTGRAFSHGCIRVNEPLEFARKLFGYDGTLTGKQINQIVESGQTMRVDLQNKVPVHLSYFTAWVDEDGLPYFYSDVYDRDALVARLLFGSV